MRQISTAFAMPKESFDQFLPIFREAFECLRCGKCCSGATGQKGIVLSPSEIDRIAEGLGMSVGKVKRLVRKEGGLRILHTPCPFLGDGECTIYEHRPDGCRGFPIMREAMIEGQLMASISTVCDGVKRLFGGGIWR